MNKKRDIAPKGSYIGKIVVLMFALFLVQMFTFSYLKEKASQEYNLINQITLSKSLYSEISLIFRRNSNIENFDRVIAATKELDITLELLETEVDDRKIFTIIKKIREDFEKSKELVERYKSWQGLVLNSTRLVHDMHTYLENAIVDDGSIDTKKSIALVDDVIFYIDELSYSDGTDFGKLKQQLARLKNSTVNNKEIAIALEKIQKHTDVIVTGRKVSIELSNLSQGLEIKESINFAYSLLMKALENQDKSNSFNVYVLNALFLLLIAIAYVLYKKEERLSSKVYGLNKKFINSLTKLKSKNTENVELIEKFDKNVIISKTDLNGVITYASKAFVQVSGYSKEELVGKTHNLVRHPDMPKALFQDMWSTLKAEKPWHGEVKNLTKSGEDYWVEVYAEPEYGKDGKHIGYSAIRQIITSRKALEEMKESLEEQVKARTIELEKMVDNVEYLSHTDELTKLYNRRYYSKVLDNEINRAQRQKEFFNYMLIDIDNFKKYNDNYGHQAGDFVLEKVAKTFVSILHRSTDLAFRVGGEEFVIVYMTKTEEESRMFAQKITDSVSGLELEHKHNEPYNAITISSGLVFMNSSSQYTNENNIYKKADELLYLAKKEGKNRFRDKKL